MAVPAGTTQTYDKKTIREDLSDYIYNVAPTETPLMAAAKQESCSNTNFEWPIDDLAAPDGDNKHIEGDDTEASDSAQPDRVSSYTQIMKKAATVAGSTESVTRAGEGRQMGYEIAKKTKELKRDMETRICGNYASAAGAAGTARETAGLPAWLETNTGAGATGVDGGFNSGVVAARTDGTLRDLTINLFRGIESTMWDNGANPSICMMPGGLKSTFSKFAGVVDNRRDVSGQEQAQIVGGADVYVGDFGVLTIVPNRFMRTRDVLFIDPDFVGVSYLRTLSNTPLAKTGDSEKRQLLVEFGLQVHNEAAHGLLTDVQAA